MKGINKRALLALYVIIFFVKITVYSLHQEEKISDTF